MQSFLTVLQQFLLVLKHWTERSSEHLFTYSSLMSLYSSLFPCALCQGRCGTSALRGLLAISLTLNAVFTSAYVYRSLR